MFFSTGQVVTEASSSFDYQTIHFLNRVDSGRGAIPAFLTKSRSRSLNTLSFCRLRWITGSNLHLHFDVQAQ